MKRVLILSLLAALLGGCVVTPVGYRDYDDRYYRRHDYYHDYYYRDDRRYGHDH
jgi:hypothetical protein